LERKRSDRRGYDGRLPATAPLANPYVPFQLENPPKYETRKALVRGTMFPGLDLPFMGMVNKTEKPVTPMTELQCMAFAIQELALYLDTHRDDQEALELYYEKQLCQLEEDTERQRAAQRLENSPVRGVRTACVRLSLTGQVPAPRGPLRPISEPVFHLSPPFDKSTR